MLKTICAAMGCTQTCATVGERISDCSSDEGEMKVPLRNKDMNRMHQSRQSHQSHNVVMHVLDAPGEAEPFGKPGSGLDSVRIGKGDTSRASRESNRLNRVDGRRCFGIDGELSTEDCTLKIVECGSLVYKLPVWGSRERRQKMEMTAVVGSRLFCNKKCQKYIKFLKEEMHRLEQEEEDWNSTLI